MVAAPDRDSCKQRRVNLKMQIPPQGFWPGRREGRRGDTWGRRRCGQSPTAGNGRKRAQKSAALPPAALGGNRRNHATHRLQRGFGLCCLACTCESQHCPFFDNSRLIRRCAVARRRQLRDYYFLVIGGWIFLVGFALEVGGGGSNIGS